MTKIVLIGAGGHCRSVLDSALACGEFEVIGIVDENLSIGDNLYGVPIIGKDSDLPEIAKITTNAHICIGSVGDTTLRKKIYNNVCSLGFNMVNIIDPTSTVSKFASLGKGIFVGKNAILNAGCIINDMAIINTNAVVEHDVRIGKFTHVSVSAVICGGVTVLDNSHISANSVVVQSINIGEKAIVGAGAVVIRDVEDGQCVVGNPAKQIRK